MQFCIKGHDILKVGRYASGECKECKSCFYQMNKKQIRKYQNIHYSKNKKEVTRYKRQKHHTDLQYRMAHYLRTRTMQAIKHNYKSGSAVRDLGCTIAELKEFLEKQFKFGMSWDNWGNGKNKWNIDHIKAVTTFNLTNRGQFLKAVNYRNLQPLWYIDNIKKGAI